MNYSIVFYIIGWILNFEAAFMALPTAVALIYRESEVWCFLATMAVCLMVGMILVRRKPKNQIFYVAESFVAVSLSWVLLSVMGAVPFVLSGYIPNPIDALFETVSGFTTTGASILSSVEQLPKCLLFWRSFTHWIGGMGVLVFLLSVLPMVGGSHMNLMKAESPGPIVSRLGSEGPDDGEAVIPDLPGDDDPRGCDSDSWENADFRRDHDHGRNSRYRWFCNPE